MPIPALAIPVISLVSTLFKGWMKNKQVKQADKREITKAKVQAKIRKIDNLYNMDTAAANDMRYSFKDEFLVLLISTPYIMCFIPSLAPYVAEGFSVLAHTPDWYKYSFMGIIAATFGLRAWFSGFKKV